MQTVSWMHLGIMQCPPHPLPASRRQFTDQCQQLGFDAMRCNAIQMQHKRIRCNEMQFKLNATQINSPLVQPAVTN